MGKRNKRLNMARYAKKYAKIRSIVAAKLERAKEHAMEDGIITKEEEAEIKKIEAEAENLRALEETSLAEEKNTAQEIPTQPTVEETPVPESKPAPKRKPRAKKAPAAKRKPRKARAPKKTEQTE